MKGWLPLTLGLLAVVIGAVWTLQGLGRLGGSVMTGEPLWAVIGPVVVVAGLVLVVLGLRARNRGTPPPP
ncbi:MULTISPECIES: hypothetical protein [unclassified Plantactinospora]|uniref:hypothetical protein n=1 Tax=unclassified Plantactinospora TaxID=2631981 RepID=UPI000D1707EC|nr:MULTISPECIES: hypothetical protein [unclassified Plantactinospora]AVT31972.1 hypothetical protein C6361_23655 [Plantactinospora sp. BC1]AVT40402.1 hypothetical protein C6W10_32535 [Plantactinospora sp. BB1]